MGWYVQHDLPVMWPNFGKNRSKVKVTRTHIVYSWNHHNSLLGGLSTSWLGADMWTIPQLAGHKLVAMATTFA